MISLKKKATVAKSYSWRPNFRDYEALPDIRAVRTKVFLPVIFITIAAVFCAFILFREYKALNINKSIAQVSSEIESYQVDHDEKVALNSEFMNIAKDLDEIQSFKEGRLVGSDYLLGLSSRLQEGMYLTRVDYGEDKAVIEGNVTVPAEEASRLVDDYMNTIKEADVLQGVYTEYKLTSLERDKDGTTIKFRIEVTLEEKGKK